MSIATRSQNSYGRVRNVLATKKINPDAIEKSVVYDALAQGQKQIFARVNFERQYDVGLGIGQDSYLLSSLESNDDRIFIKGIKTFILPSTWRYKLEYVANKDWNTIINSHRAYPAQPIYATLFNNSLYLYPVPTTEDVLTLWAKLKLPETDISETNDPEVDGEWDFAIEQFALYTLTGDTQFMQTFMEQINTLSKTTSGAGYMLQKEMR